MPRILVTGAHGQVGKALQQAASQWPSFTFLYTDRDTLDITDAQAVKTYFANHAITHVINCAAYTAVDKAETDVDLAQKINVTAPEILAKACVQKKARMIHISSDYVYHNSLDRPLLESDPTDPQSVYAQTKLDGDVAVLAVHGHNIILRTSWVYGQHGHNFVKTMMRLGAERDALSVVFDQIGTPTYTRDLADALLHIVAADSNGRVDKHELGGVYHYANEGVTSWYDFAHAIFELADIDCKLSPIRSAAYPTPAARPTYSVLDKNRFKATFGMEIPHWRDSLKHCLAALVENETLLTHT
ncbi:MAG: dTDP-4-dehydrorhamnose reductase [Bacteroidia bacterium]